MVVQLVGIVGGEVGELLGALAWLSRRALLVATTNPARAFLRPLRLALVSGLPRGIGWAPHRAWVSWCWAIALAHCQHLRIGERCLSGTSHLELCQWKSCCAGSGAACQRDSVLVSEMTKG